MINKEISIHSSNYVKQVYRPVLSILSSIRQRLHTFHFKPKFLPTFITLLFFFLFVTLGVWQLKRMTYKKALEQKTQQVQYQQHFVIKLPENSNQGSPQGLNQNSPQNPTLSSPLPSPSQHPPPRHYLSSYRHLGYALQWFIFALLLLIYYGILSCEKKSLTNKPTVEKN